MGGQVIQGIDLYTSKYSNWLSLWGTAINFRKLLPVFQIVDHPLQQIPTESHSLKFTN